MATTSTLRQPRGLASSALKGAGLITTAVDHDTSMRDISKGGRKSHGKAPKKTGHRMRAVDPYKASGVSDLPQRMLASRISANLSNPLAIRGSSSKPANQRLRQKGAANHQVQAKPLDVWREFVQKRWNAEARFLNLERMADDEVLKKYNYTPPGVSGATQKELPVIFKLASQLKPAVETISLANNNFSSGTLLASLAHYLPSLSNLSLQGNKLRTWKDIDYISGRKEKLKHLRELILIDNPVREFELKNGRAENYRSEMTRRFPSLEVLDQEAVTKISFDVPVASSSRSDPHMPAPTSFPFPMGPSFITGVDGAVISNFLTRFFPLFDSQRTGLSDVYDPGSTFSYSAVTAIPNRARVQGFHTSKEMPNQRKLEWAPWLNNMAGGSRNLSRMGGGLDRMVKSLHSGPEEIVRAMTALPATVHDVAGAADKFCIDAWPVGQGEAMLLFLCVHGEFAEAPSQGIRSFDRSFILAPAPPGSKAALAGWDVTILTDQMIVRAYSSPEAWKPGPMKVQNSGEAAQQQQPTLVQVPPQMLAPAVQAELNAIPEPQHGLVATICQRTGLNVKFSLDCLEGNGWDVEKAVANFEQVKGSLGREAFL